MENWILVIEDCIIYLSKQAGSTDPGRVILGWAIFESGLIVLN